MANHRAWYHLADLQTGLQTKYLRKIAEKKKKREEAEFQKKLKNSLLFPIDKL